MSLYILNTIFNNAPQPWQIGFQDSAAPGFTGIVELCNTIFNDAPLLCQIDFYLSNEKEKNQKLLPIRAIAI